MLKVCCCLVLKLNIAGALRKLGKNKRKTWAEPLGKGLSIGAKIVTGMESFVPFGASLLNPEPTLEDLREELREIKEMMKDDMKSKVAARAFQRQVKELQQRIESPAGEIRSNFDEIKREMKDLLKSIEQENNMIFEDISRMKDVISQTFLLVADVKYRVLFNIFYLSINNYN